MKNNGIGGGGIARSHLMLPQAALPAPASAPTPSLTPSSPPAGLAGAWAGRSDHAGSSGDFRGAVFQHGSVSAQLPRDLARRLPLRSLNPGRQPKMRSPASGPAAPDEGLFEAPSQYPVKGARHSPLPPVILPTGEERDGDASDDGQRRHQRSDIRFKTSTFVTGFSAAQGMASAAKHAGKAGAALPPMNSWREVLQHIRFAAQADPSEKALGLLIRKINAAVMDNKIKLPALAGMADVRALLVESFGSSAASTPGGQGNTAMSHGMNVLLPIWLLNMGRSRTPTQRAHAAARLSLPRTSFGPG